MSELPYYKMPENIKTIILELVKKAFEIDLGNVNFTVFGRDDDIGFFLSERIGFWDLVVAYDRACKRDIYKIVDGVLIYEYSEKD